MRNAIRLGVIAGLLFCLFNIQPAQAAKSGSVVYTVTPTVTDSAKSVRLWLPYPLSNADQDISAVSVTGNYAQSAVYTDPGSGATFLFAEWTGVKEKPHLTMAFHVASKFAKGPASLPAGDGPIPADIAARYLAGSEWVPTSLFAAEAAEIVKGKQGILAKARAVYDWTVEHTFRDPDVKGCGLGVPGRTMNECKGGGKCADISSVFVTMARAAGIPARDVFGLRMASPKTGEITGDYHCWAEFYLPGHGWVMVDPADVRKMMLVNKLELDSPETATWREFFWNGDDLFRIVLNKDSRGVVLTPAQQGGLINYLMYPFGQVDGETLNYFDPKGFGYKVEFTVDK